jgi:hypothetical protein
LKKEYNSQLEFGELTVAHLLYEAADELMKVEIAEQIKINAIPAILRAKENKDE